MFQNFYDLVYSVLFSDGDNFLQDFIKLDFFGSNVDLSQYFSMLIAIICTIIVYVVCCLLIYKMVKLIGRLFVRL